MNIRNAKYNQAGTIDCEIEHPVYGWIPFTASPDDVEPHGVAIYEAALLGTVAAYVAPPPAPPTVPQVVSRFQARAALHLAGLLPQVDALMADPATDMLARLAWQDAAEFRRTSPVLLAMSAALGLTDAQLDDLFTTAHGVTA